MMARKRTLGFWGMLFSVLCALFFIIGSAAAQPPNVQSVNCKDTQIEWDVAPEAEIVSFDCALGQHQGHPAAIYTVALKNISDQPSRFRLTIFLLEIDKAVSYLVPTKGKPPVVDPGAEHTAKIPFMNVATMPDTIQVTVKPKSVD
jgi:hypothetical protein